MGKPFRIIDTGIRDGRAQIAFDQALVDLHQTGEVSDTLRFLRFPPTALIGRHQALSQELKLDYCAQNNIRTVRRITGGGPLYFDEGQLGWELVFSRSSLGTSDLRELSLKICEAVALGLSKLGVDAKYRAPTDIEVAGRKISGTGGFFDGDTAMYQGTVLIDMDPADMIATLNVPSPEIAKSLIDSAAQRVVTFKELLRSIPEIDEVKAKLVEGFAEHLGIDAVPGEITAREEELAKQYFDDEIGTDDFVAEIDNPAAEAGILSARHAGAGGAVTAYVRLEGPQQDRFREVLITGDFFIAPPRTIFDLEAALRGTFTKDIQQTVTGFFEIADVGLMTVGADDFATALQQAVAAK
ncbi:MAG: lipoate--protein ligase family protein [Rhizobiales bacterium]|nr:lipoate--protein ligase family protein [Hyphomicrobiales bacterium]